MPKPQNNPLKPARSKAEASCFGAALRQLRKQRGFTIERLAEQVGVTKGYLSMIENGRVDNPPSGKILYALELVLEAENGVLTEADRWDRTPEPIRAALVEAQRRAEQSERALAALRGKAKEVDSAPAGFGRDLDALYRSGALLDLVGGQSDTTSETSPKIHGQFPGVPVINKVAAGLPAGFTDLDYPAGAGEEVVHVPGYTGVHGQDDPDAFAAIIEGDSMTPEYRPGDIVVFSPLADVIDGCDCYARLEPDHETTFKRVYLQDGGQQIRLVALNKKYPTRTIDREQVAGLYRAVWRMSRL